MGHAGTGADVGANDGYKCYLFNRTFLALHRRDHERSELHVSVLIQSYQLNQPDSTKNE
jgi:hypothetical protein